MQFAADLPPPDGAAPEGGHTSWFLVLTEDYLPFHLVCLWQTPCRVLSRIGETGTQSVGRPTAEVVCRTLMAVMPPAVPHDRIVEPPRE